MTPDEADGEEILVGTLNKLGDAFGRGSLGPLDVLLMDEALQANSTQYYLVAGLADRHLLMGDRGQLAPFTTAPEGDRWRGLAEDPLLTAAEVVSRNHPEATETRKLPITRRLDSRAVEVARAFYPDHQFEAAVLDGVRRLRLGRVARASKLDHILASAAGNGWAHVELPTAAVTVADRETISLVVDLVRRLFERKPKVSCEDRDQPTSLQQNEVAVAVSHNDQKNLLRVALDDAGLEKVVVNTANKLQGLTFEVVVAWHPLAGLQEVDEFHLDPGRLCVMLTRHRQACIVVGREADRDLVQGIPPASPSFVGWDASPTLDGWYAHEAVFSALAPHRFAAG